MIALQGMLCHNDCYCSPVFVYFSSAAEIYFNSSINHICVLVGDLDFSNSTPDLWTNITATCIVGSSDLSILSRMTVSGQGCLLTAGQCQTYTDQQSMQCRMDCLLSFLIVIPNNVETSGYIHLRSISCNQTLFTTSINTIFNNANNIQPSFTPKPVKGYNTVHSQVFVFFLNFVLTNCVSCYYF